MYLSGWVSLVHALPLGERFLPGAGGPEAAVLADSFGLRVPAILHRPESHPGSIHAAAQPTAQTSGMVPGRRGDGRLTAPHFRDLEILPGTSPAAAERSRRTGTASRATESAKSPDRSPLPSPVTDGANLAAVLLAGLGLICIRIRNKARVTTLRRPG